MKGGKDEWKGRKKEGRGRERKRGKGGIMERGRR